MRRRLNLIGVPPDTASLDPPDGSRRTAPRARAEVDRCRDRRQTSGTSRRKTVAAQTRCRSGESGRRARLRDADGGSSGSYGMRRPNRRGEIPRTEGSVPRRRKRAARRQRIRGNTGNAVRSPCRIASRGAGSSRPNGRAGRLCRANDDAGLRRRLTRRRHSARLSRPLASTWMCAYANTGANALSVSASQAMQTFRCILVGCWLLRANTSFRRPNFKPGLLCGNVLAYSKNPAAGYAGKRSAAGGTLSFSLSRAGLILTASGEANAG